MDVLTVQMFLIFSSKENLMIFFTRTSILTKNRLVFKLSTRRLVKRSEIESSASPSALRLEESLRLKIDFKESRPFRDRKFKELIRAWWILKITSFDIIVHNAERAFLFGRRAFPSVLFEKVMNGTFYGHFTAGNTKDSSKLVVSKLHEAGIKTMLMVPIENSFTDCKKDMLMAFQANHETLMDSTSLTGLLQPYGFSQMKITALEDIVLFRKINEFLIEYECDHREDGDWDIKHVASFVENQEFEKIIFSDFSEEENERIQIFFRRINSICKLGRNQNTRIMIDAEQSFIQAAIGYITLVMQAVYNKHNCVVFNTYQCYRKDTLERIKADYRLGRQLGFKIAGKFVRGAYMFQERMLADRNGYESPINDTYEETNRKYHECVNYILPKIMNNECSIMIATHNEATIEYTINQMKGYGITKDDQNLCFGQIYGMCDHVSFTLGQLGYQIYKSVPVGTIDDTLLYLTRRAIENRSVLQRTKVERSILRKEMYRKVARK